MKTENHIGSKIKRLHWLIKQDINRSLSALDLTSSQAQVLHRVMRALPEQLFPKDIEKALHLKHPTVLGILQRLEAKEYIRMECDRADRRCRCIIATEKTLKIRQEVSERIETIEKTMLLGMSDAEIGQFSSYLDRAAENLSKLTSEEDCKV